MLIDSTTGTNPLTDGQGAQDASPTTVGSPNEFLRLFIAQLANQNPLDPQDGAEFVAQLAQFTTVEQAAETNRRLEEILAGQMSVSNASLAGFVGKTGTVDADRITLSSRGEGIPSLAVDLSGAASEVTVTVRDAAGNQVKRIQLGPQPAGKVSVPWDGTSDTGSALPPGDYKIEVTATSTDGTELTTNPTMTGLIQAIDFIDGFPRLRLGAVSAAPSDVLSIE